MASDVPVQWIGSSGHVLHQPWIPQWFRDDLAQLILELVEAAPEGLDSKRIAFKRQGQIEKGSRKFKQLSLLQRQAQASDQLLDERAELLVGVQLLRAGVLTQMRKETPDFDCRWGQFEFGVEVTSRARREVGAALHEILERGLWDGPNVSITLMRSGKLLFSEDPAVIAGIADRVVAEVNERSACTSGLPLSGSVPVPELGFTAVLSPGAGVSRPGMRVTYESLLTTEEWDHHWAMAARQIKDKIEDKGLKTYELPSIVVLDVSRLGEAGQIPLGSWTSEFRGVLDNCKLGNLSGALLVRSTLTSRVIEPLCWRGDSVLLPAVVTVLLGDQIAKPA
jgi:hypothetical protein